MEKILAEESMRKVVIIWFVMLVSAFSLSAGVIIEGFEHGNEALYSFGAGVVDNLSLTAAAAHDGALGARFGDVVGAYWRYRTDVVTAPGNSYQSFVRFNGSGRAYIGVGATSEGAYSMVAATNTNEIILQSNNSWSYFDMAAVSYPFAQNTWYLLELVWALSGDMTVNLYNEAGSPLLASTGAVPTGFTTPGGLAIRGFSGLSGEGYVDIDTIRTGGGIVPIPEPATGLLFAGGMALLGAWRRRSR